MCLEPTCALEGVGPPREDQEGSAPASEESMAATFLSLADGNRFNPHRPVLPPPSSHNKTKASIFNRKNTSHQMNSFKRNITQINKCYKKINKL